MCTLTLVAGLTTFLCPAVAQSSQQTTSPAEDPAHKLPVLDGGAGPCSLELQVRTTDGKPVYAATVKVHIVYGFAGARRLDLQAATNVDGNVKFIGLPARVRKPPLEFHASTDKLVGTVTYDPQTECQTQHDLTLDVAMPLEAK